jgi:hypothetical protein
LQPPAPPIDIAIKLPAADATATLVAVESTEFGEAISISILLLLGMVCTSNNRSGQLSKDM